MTAICDTTELAEKLEAYLEASRERRAAINEHGTNIRRDIREKTEDSLTAVTASRVRCQRAYRNFDHARTAYALAGGSVRGSVEAQVSRQSQRESGLRDAIRRAGGVSQ